MSFWLKFINPSGSATQHATNNTDNTKNIFLKRNRQLKFNPAKIDDRT
jgi:hypothetical protein